MVIPLGTAADLMDLNNEHRRRIDVYDQQIVGKCFCQSFYRSYRRCVRAPASPSAQSPYGRSSGSRQRESRLERSFLNNWASMGSWQKRNSDPSYTFRRHLRERGGAVEE